jgi:hypothetical protein
VLREHKADLKTQATYTVNHLGYWFDEKREKEGLLSDRSCVSPAATACELRVTDFNVVIASQRWLETRIAKRLTAPET